MREFSMDSDDARERRASRPVKHLNSPNKLRAPITPYDVRRSRAEPIDYNPFAGRA
jgi:hypothetical protein